MRTKNNFGILVFFVLAILLFTPFSLALSLNLNTFKSGAVVEETNYEPYGQVLDGGDSRYGDTFEGGDSRYLFTGKERDKTGLDYFGARYYISEKFMHFTQPDTNIPDIYNPQDLNRFSYVRNNPYKYVDESGDAAVLVVAISFIAIRGTIGAFEASVADVSSQVKGGETISLSRVGTQAAKGFGKGVIIGGTEVLIIVGSIGVGQPVAGAGLASTIGEKILNPIIDISYKGEQRDTTKKSNIDKGYDSLQRRNERDERSKQLSTFNLQNLANPRLRFLQQYGRSSCLSANCYSVCTSGSCFYLSREHYLQYKESFFKNKVNKFDDKKQESSKEIQKNE